MKGNQSLRRLGTGLLLGAIVIFLLVPGAGAQSKFTTLHAFKPGNGRGVGTRSSLVFDAAGNLYGTALGGGKHNGGVVFKLTPNAGGSWTYSVIYRFCSLENCSDGSDPLAGLIVDGAGNLYGTTYNGGATNNGTVFELTPSGQENWTESVLYSFAGAADGAGPLGSLIFDQSGNLYGTTSLADNRIDTGTVFELTPNKDGTWSESVLYTFCSLTNCSDGYMLNAALIFDGAGNLYGTTIEGGQSLNAGTVFELSRNKDGSWSESVLYNFCSLASCTDGFEPLDSLIFDTAGNLYGTTWEGGSNNSGVAFKLTPQGGGSWSESVIHTFGACSVTNCPDGAAPFANLTIDTAGNLYGTTYYGGNATVCYAGCGLVFKLTPTAGTWQKTVLHRFDDKPGRHPLAGVIFDTTGNLYGTTSGDGNGIFIGSVFKIAP